MRGAVLKNRIDHKVKRGPSEKKGPSEEIFWMRRGAYIRFREGRPTTGGDGARSNEITPRVVMITLGRMYESEKDACAARRKGAAGDKRKRKGRVCREKVGVGGGSVLSSRGIKENIGPKQEDV